MARIIYCMVLFVVVSASLSYAAPADVPKTGQSTSYDANTVQADDGALQKGAAWPSPRFTDNADGTVTDNLTGLKWLKDANCIQTKYPSFDGGAATGDGAAGDGFVTWQHALDFVTGINAGTYSNCGGGQTDWRLPNVNELESLVDASKYNPALPASHPFTNAQVNYHWSSSTHAASTFSAWGVNIVGGTVSGRDKAFNGCVWPVRGGQ